MRAFRFRFAAPALLLSALAAGPLRADASRELIVGIAAPRAGATAMAQRARFADRMRALGLTAYGTLADGLGLAGGPATGGEGAAFEARTSRASRGARRNPFDLDPARVWRLAARDSLAAFAAVAPLSADPEIEWIEPNQPREFVSLAAGTAATPPVFPNDPHFRDTRQWWLWNAGPGSAYGGVARADIHAPEAWAITTGSNDLRLAIADTGVDPDQPEYQCRMPDGSMRLERGINVTLDPSGSFADSAGHGVSVAGVFAARTNEGWHIADSLGVAGICGGDGRGNFGCRLIPIKITFGRSGTSSSFDIARAMVYAVECGARAMNLSFAGGGRSRVERMAMYYAITRGCVVSAAAGNSGFVNGSRPIYPAAYAAEGLGIQTGATDFFDRRTSFSSYGPGLDLMAPGWFIWTTYLTYPHPISGAPGRVYNRDSGTSYAAPMTTGAVGLLAAARPELLDLDFQRILRESADDIGIPGVDSLTGWGRLNLARALEAVGPGIGIWHDEVLGVVTPTGRTDTLVLTESGPGTFDRFREWSDAAEYEVRATIAIPDSFVAPVRIWPRVGGTMTVRGDFRIPYFTPWAEVIAQDDRSFTLRGYVYRQSDATCRPCGDDAWLPLPPDQARFGFTVIGSVDRTPRPASRATGTTPRVIVTPNPFVAGTRIAAPGPGRVEIADAAGRRVRSFAVADHGGAWEWDGRDAHGRGVAPGLYFVRYEGAAGRATAKLLRLEGGSR